MQSPEQLAIQSLPPPLTLDRPRPFERSISQSTYLLSDLCRMTTSNSGNPTSKWIWIISLAIALGGTWYAIRRFENGATVKEPTKDAAIKSKASWPSVDVCQPLVRSIVEWDEFPGRLEAVESVEVRSRVSGYLKITKFNEGQLVKRGDVIAEIDPRPFLAELKRSQSNALESQAKLQQAVTAIEQSKAEAERARARRELTQKQVERMRSLRLQNAVSQDELDVAEAAAIESEANLVVAVSSIQSAEANLTAAQAGVEIAQDAVDIAKLNLQYTQIIAPIDGLISRRFVTEGNMISGGLNESTLITTIVSVDPIHCYFDADENTYLKYTKLAMDGVRPSSREVFNPVYIALADNRKSFPYKGHMDFVDNRFDKQTGTIRGRAILPNPDSVLTPGMFVRLRLPGGPPRDTILIPDAAVGTDQVEKFVLVVDEESKVEKRFVSLGPMSHGLRIVRSGLSGDEKVIVSGLQRSKVGEGVNVKAVADVLFKEEALPDVYEPYRPGDSIIPRRLPAANATDRESTEAEPTGTEPTGTEPTGTEPTGKDETSAVDAGKAIVSPSDGNAKVEN